MDERECPFVVIVMPNQCLQQNGGKMAVAIIKVRLLNVMIIIIIQMDEDGKNLINTLDRDLIVGN